MISVSITQNKKISLISTTYIFQEQAKLRRWYRQKTLVIMNGKQARNTARLY